MWLVLVTNQGYPVQFSPESDRESARKVFNRFQVEWGTKFLKRVAVLESLGFVGRYSSIDQATLKEEDTWVDNLNVPRYVLSMHSGFDISTATTWKFCPDCGCSWLNHLITQTDLEPRDWTPCPCTDCGCKKAMR